MVITKAKTVRFLAFLLSIVALIWVAFWNHYPVLFYDTGWYLRAMISGPPDGQKTAFYPLFMKLSGGMFSLWAVAIMQAVLTCYVLGSFCKTMGLRRQNIIIILLLCATTCISWEVSYIMPDVFSALQILTLFLLTFHCNTLTRTERVLLALIYMLSNIVHHSNYLLSASLLLLVFMAAWLWRIMPLRRLLLPCALTLASLCALAMANFVYNGSPYLSNSSHAYIVARMIEDGIVPKLLAEHCSEKHYVLCPYAKTLPTGRTEFLFGQAISDNAIFEKIGGWEHSSAALTPIIIDSLRYYPMQNISVALNETIEQLGKFNIADFVFRFPPQQYVTKEMQVYSPEQYTQWSSSLQQQGELESYAFAVFHDATMALYVLLCIIVVWYTRGEEPYHAIKQAICFMLTAIVVNAAITGTFSHAECRYESRLIWLIPLCVITMIAQHMAHQNAMKSTT